MGIWGFALPSVSRLTLGERWLDISAEWRQKRGGSIGEAVGLHNFLRLLFGSVLEAITPDVAGTSLLQKAAA